MNTFWTTPADPNLTFTAGPAPEEMLGAMERLWRECNAVAEPPDYIIVPGECVRRRYTIRRRGKKFCFGPIMRPAKWFMDACEQARKGQK